MLWKIWNIIEFESTFNKCLILQRIVVITNKSCYYCTKEYWKVPSPTHYPKSDQTSDKNVKNNIYKCVLKKNKSFICVE